MKKTEAYRDARGRSGGNSAGGSKGAADTARADTPPRRAGARQGSVVTREEQREQGAALHATSKLPWGAGVAGAQRVRPVLAREAPHRQFRGPRRATRSSATVGGLSERLDLMQRQLVLVEYGEQRIRAALPDSLGRRE